MPRPTTRVVEAHGSLYLIIDRRLIERVPVGATEPSRVPRHVHPKEIREARCVLCGETIGEEVDIGEMYGDPTLEHGVGPDEVSYGLVHVQCGLDRGWEVA